MSNKELKVLINCKFISNLESLNLNLAKHGILESNVNKGILYKVIPGKVFYIISIKMLEESPTSYFE